MTTRVRRRTAAATVILVLATLVPSAVRAAGTWGTFDVPSIGDFVIAPDGSLLGSDLRNGRIYRVSSAGAVTVFAGAGDGGFDNGYSGDGGPAIDAHFGGIVGLAWAGDGSLLAVDHLNDVIRRIDALGIVTTVAGSGPKFSWSKEASVPGLKGVGDGGPATAAVLDAPWGIRVDRAGNLYVADRDHDAIRRVDARGTITTVAGTGQRGFGGDGGPGTEAKLNRPMDIAFPAGGGFLIADENNARIRRVSPSGTISTFAGNGKLGCGGDRGPAVAASLQNVGGLAIGLDGTVVAAQGECFGVRAIGPDGIIRRLVGSGVEGCAGFDGGRAPDAQLEDPAGVGFDASGALIVTDPGCQVVLRVDRQGRLHVVASLVGLGG